MNKPASSTSSTRRLLSLARREVARSGRLRWLQKVETAETTWDAFEAVRGRPLPSLIKDGQRVPWGTLRHWLHENATVLRAETCQDGSGASELEVRISHAKHGQLVHRLEAAGLSAVH